MSENGHEPPRRSLTGDVISVLEDQVELISLELGYETEQGAKRAVALLLAAFLGMLAFAILQIAIVKGLELLGVSLGVACVILATAYTLVAALLVMKFGRRDKRAGEPFQGTRSEIRKNLEWMRQLLP